MLIFSGLGRHSLKLTPMAWLAGEVPSEGPKVDPTPFLEPGFAH